MLPSLPFSEFASYEIRNPSVPKIDLKTIKYAPTLVANRIP